MWSQPYFTKEETIRSLLENGLFTKKIELAFNQAIKSHAGQKRDSGKSYLEEHIFPIVVSVLQKYKTELFAEDLLLTCILHDVIEDDETVSIEALTNIFGEKIISYVLYLTKSPFENAHGLPQTEKVRINRAVLERLKEAPQLVQIAKLEDRLNNITSIESISNPKFVRYVQETKESYLPFAQYTKQPLYFDLLNIQIKRLLSSIKKEMTLV